MSALELTAVARLALSREKLRTAMTQPADKAQSEQHANSQVTGLLELLKTTMPKASLLIDTLNTWWMHYTTEGSRKTATAVVKDLISPLAKRYPLVLVCGAVAVGGLVVWLRPWRWALKPSLMAAWGTAAVTGALRSGTLQAWVLSLLTTPPPAAKETAPLGDADLLAPWRKPDYSQEK